MESIRIFAVCREKLFLKKLDFDTQFKYRLKKGKAK